MGGPTTLTPTAPTPTVLTRLERGLLMLSLKLSHLSTPTAMFLPTPMGPTTLTPTAPTPMELTSLERGLLRLRLRLSLLFTPTAMFLPTPMVPTGLQPMLEFTDQLIPCGDKSIPNQMA